MSDADVSSTAAFDADRTPSYNTTAFRPTFRASDLTGCYAGTGGSTVSHP